MPKEEFDKILSDLEQEKVGQFIQDDVMREAVKKIMLHGIYTEGTLKKGEATVIDPYTNFAFMFASSFPSATPEQVGNNMKACWEGINLLINAYKDLEQYRPMQVPKPKENKAR